MERNSGAAVKDVVILGGPNGAGKTTLAQVLLPKKLAITEFVNADEIARGLSPFNPEGAAFAAGRVMIGRMRDLVLRGESFAVETTCAGRSHIELLRRCKADGWRVTLLFLWLRTPAMAIDRVARRVRSGGHNIPAEIIVRRYWNGLRNMRQFYLPLADSASIHDNSDGAWSMVAERAEGSSLLVHDAARWKMIEDAAR